MQPLPLRLLLNTKPQRSGCTDVVYTSGNQGKPTRPNEPEGFSQAGLVEGSEQEWLESFFA